MTAFRSTHLDKGVDGEDDELGLCFGIVHEIQIDSCEGTFGRCPGGELNSLVDGKGQLTLITMTASWTT